MQRLGEMMDVASTENGSETVRVTCAICGQEFECQQRYVRYLEEMRPVPVPPVCADCLDAKQRAEAAEEYRRRFDRTMAQYRDGHLGARLAEVTFADFLEGPHNAAALNAAKRWLRADPRPNLLLVGPVQSGKSYLAACVHNALLADQQPAYWLNAGTLVDRIRRGFTDREATVTANRWQEHAETAPVLFLDDLGKVHPGRDISWVEATFYGIIEARYRDELPTVITTEWKAAVLVERVGESVVSRLTHGAWAVGIDRPPRPYRRRSEVPHGD
ncbi:MAG: ATP-binding protein [Thermoleophilia bacterium]|nr:ATP-binding protein [Thermoleophilia bacterium]